MAGKKKPGITIGNDAACENPAGIQISFYEYLSVSALTGRRTFVESFETIRTTVFNAIDERLVTFGYTVFFRLFGTMYLHIFILL